MKCRGVQLSSIFVLFYAFPGLGLCADHFVAAHVLRRDQAIQPAYRSNQWMVPNQITSQLNIAAAAGLRVAISSYPRNAGEISGDFFHFHSRRDGKFSIYLGDGEEHGPPAAKTAAKFKAALASPEMASALEEPTSLACLLEIDELFGLEPDDVLASLAHLLIDFENRTLTFSAAMHIAPVYLIKKNGEVHLLEAGGVHIGDSQGPFFSRQFHTDEDRIQFDPDDTILLTSDGILDNLDRDKVMLRKKIPGILQGLTGNYSPSDVLRAVYRQAFHRTDDETAIAVQFKARGK